MGVGFMSCAVLWAVADDHLGTVIHVITTMYNANTVHCVEVQCFM